MAGLAVTFVVNYHRADAAQATIYTIYPDSVTPQIVAENDPQSVVLGVKFSAQTAGEVLGVRYYGASANGGSHVGTLWSSTGSKLASATFSNSSGTGWRTVKFSTPVKIAAKTSYVASYSAPQGHYAQSAGQFANNASVGTGPMLRASAGVYTYHSGEMPAASWHSASYYVDVLFQSTGSVPPSSSAPVSTSAKPTVSPTRTTAPPSSKPPVKTSTPPPTKTTAPSTSQPAPPSKTTTPPPPPSSTPPPPPAGGRMTVHPAAGVPAGVTLTKYTGPSTITQDGTVIDSKSITGSLEIKAKNVTIIRSRITGNGDDGIHVSGSLTISYSTISGGSNGVGGDNYSANYVEVTDLTDDGFKLGNNAHVDHSWCHDLTPGSAAHADCGQMQAGVTNMTVTNSWFDGGRNSALFIAPDLGPSSNGPVTISGNVLGNGNYTLYCVDGNNGQYIVKNITITNNQFLDTSQYGPATVNVPVTASNNVWFTTGKSIGGPLN